MDVNIEVFLKHAEDFARMEFRDTKSLLYFKDTEFDIFSAILSVAHRRMLMSEILKLQAEINLS
jgi:hypothetical protein